MKVLFRKTYLEINLKNIETNLKKVISKYNDYKYYIGVIKANSYGFGDAHTIKAMINAGCNYLAVATLEEALDIRKMNRDIPILCFGLVQNEYLDIVRDNNITISINSLDYAKELINLKIKNLKVHLKINTGMNRLRNIFIR